MFMCYVGGGIGHKALQAWFKRLAEDIHAIPDGSDAEIFDHLGQTLGDTNTTHDDTDQVEEDGSEEEADEEEGQVDADGEDSDGLDDEDNWEEEEEDLHVQDDLEYADL